MTRLPACNLCGATNFLVRERAEPPFSVLECRGCGLVFVDPQPDPAELERHYNADYYCAWIGDQKRERERLWHKRLDGVEARVKGGRILDVGCADGAFLYAASRRGWQISGTEYSSYAASYASKLLGIEIFLGEIFDARFPDGTFDVVTLWHVLEHMPDPLRCLKEVHRVLAPGGLLVIAVPNLEDLVMRLAYRLARFKRLRLFSVKDKEPHLYHFSTSTITRMAAAAGFSKIETLPDNGIIGAAKKLVNLAALLPYYMGGFTFFNAIQLYAVKPGIPGGVRTV